MQTDNSSSSNMSLILRDSTPADVPACADVYREAVRNGTGTFELEEPDDAEMGKRRDAILAQGLPWLVAERAGQVLGYAYANQFRPRRAYRFCVEDSIYLAPAARGQGVGKLLVAARLLLVAMHRERFCRRLLAELLPPRREDGGNAFWDAVGAPLTGLSYYRADLLCRTDK